jgi:hypothetical protein
MALLVLGPERSIISNSSLTHAGALKAAGAVNTRISSIERSVVIIMGQLYDKLTDLASLKIN